jgi:hypothetical protein
MKKNQYESIKSFITGIVFIVALMVFATIPVNAQQTVVNVNTPQWVQGNTVYATVDIDQVSSLDSGQFDLSYDSDSLSVVRVDDGSVEGKEIPVQWCSLDEDTIRVIFNLEGVSGISGSGELAKIGFEVTGDNASTLGISNGLLVDTEASEIAADWGTGTAPDTSAPGFGAVTSLAGLIVVSCLLMYNKNRRW